MKQGKLIKKINKKYTYLFVFVFDVVLDVDGGVAVAEGRDLVHVVCMIRKRSKLVQYVYMAFE